MGVGEHEMHSSPIKHGRRRNRWEDRGCTVGPIRREVDFRTCRLAMFPKVPREGSRARNPEPSHILVAHRPNTLGSYRQMASLPHPAYAYPAPAPGVHQLSFAWRSYLLASSELAAPPLSPSPLPRHLAAPWHFRGSLSLFSLFIVEGTLTCLASH